jgi:hypothetical protein
MFEAVFALSPTIEEILETVIEGAGDSFEKLLFCNQITCSFWYKGIFCLILYCLSKLGWDNFLTFFHWDLAR